MKKGQFALLAVISFMMSMIVYVVLWPMWKGIIDIAAGSITDPFVLTIIKILPIFVLFALILFLFNSLRIRGA